MKTLLLRAGILAAACPLLAAAPAPGKPARKTPRAAFTLELTASFKSGQRAPVVLYREVRLVSSSGRRRTARQQASDGRLTQRFTDPRRGRLELDEDGQGLVKVGDARPSDPAPTLGRLSSHATVLGYDTDVYERTTDDLTVHYYRAPQLDGEVIRIVRESPGSVFTLEPTRITPGEPPAEAVALPDLPVVDGPRVSSDH
jgi:hypothetical protein